MKRVFFAVVPPPPATSFLDAILAELRRRTPSDVVRWSSRDQLHFTLKFLGEQADDRVEEALAVAREVAALVGPFELAFGGAGAFPRVDRARILWVGAATGAEPMTALATALDVALGASGFSREDRPFTPHATIGRVKSRAGEHAARRALERVGEAGASPVVRIESFVLMRSETAAEGARYTVVEELRFGAQQGGAA